jgi:eukaryotic-like serine/threonine-protein kinase
MESPSVLRTVNLATNKPLRLEYGNNRPYFCFAMKSGDLLRNRYRIEEALSVGGFGATYLAVDRDYPGHPQVVVKHLLSHGLSPDMLELTRRLFNKEAEILARLGRNSDGRIPQLFAHFEENKEFYLVQEFIPGEELARELSAGKLSEPQVLEILHDILTGLKIVHEQGIVHRDLKPANIIRRDRDKTLVLIDFGAVKEVRNSNTVSPTSRSIGIGTPGYHPAEQATGYPQKASDIYAVGVIGIRALTGKEPPDPAYPDPNALSVNSQTLELDWQRFCTVSNELAAILTKMVRYVYSQRYSDATEAWGAIERLRTARQVQQPATPTAPRISVPTPVIPPPAKPQPKVAPPNPIPPQNPTKPVYAAPAPAAQPQPMLPKNPAKPVKLISRRYFLPWLGFGIGGLGPIVILALSQLGKNQYSGTLPIADTLSNVGSAPKLTKIKFTSVKLDNAGKEVERPTGSAEIFTDDLGNGVTITMVKIPAGKFVMGSPASEQERSNDEGPQHKVVVPAFYLGQTLLTQAQWQAIMGNNPSRFKGDGNLPVDSVSWLAGMDFCKKLSQKTGRTYRLPSEAEWEYACRGGMTTPFAFGETITPAVVNYNGNYSYANAARGEYRKKTTAGGSFPPNLFGLYDMHGNLWEWCLDEWFDSYSGTLADGSARGDIKSRSGDKKHLLRGGSWDLDPYICRSAHRGWYNAVNQLNVIGFRVVYAPARTS